MTKKLMTLLLFILSQPVLAEDIYTIENKKNTFFTDSDKRITVDENCKKRSKCKALSVLSKMSENKLSEKELHGGANPGPLLCKHQAKGKVVMGTDKNGNQRSFCQFKDGSIIDNGTLTYYGIMNDRK